MDVVVIIDVMVIGNIDVDVTVMGIDVVCIAVVVMIFVAIDTVCCTGYIVEMNI